MQATHATLTAKTKKGRERIKQHGATGAIRKTASSVLFSPLSGPWFLVEAADPDARWVHANRDRDFIVDLEG